MKPLSLEIHNIGPIADATIPLNKPLILLYGDLQHERITTQGEQLKNEH